MITVTPRFLAAITQAHTIAVAAAVYHPDALTTPVAVDVTGGSIMADRDARVRRQGTLDVPFDLADPFTRDLARSLPYGGYAVVERGVRFADGSSELVQLGRFRVDAVTWGELEGVCTLTLSDRMAQVQDEPLVAPYAPAGLHPSDAAKALVNDVFGAAILYHVETVPASEPVIGDAVYTDDRAAALSDLAGAADAWAFFDNLGDFVLRPRSSSAGVVWTLAAGDDGMLVNATESLERSSVRNGVLVRGQATADAPPVSALSTFDDPSSPLRWGGPFGKVALIADSQSVATTAAAQAAADSLLRLRLGLARTVVMGSVPNPALEPDDVIRLELPDGRAETHVVNAVQVGLAPDGRMEITATGTATPAAALHELSAPLRLRAPAAAGWGS